MQAIRQVYENAPASIPVPEQWRQKRMEVILLVQEDDTTNGWPADYFAQTFGSIPDLPEGESQGVHEIRESLE